MALNEQEMLLKATSVAARAHDGIRRKDGTPYIAHPVKVAIRCETVLEKIVALLHDVVEDTKVTLDDLHEIGFTYEVLEAVDAISKRPGEEYAKFIQRIKLNPLATKVKVQDIADNMEDQSALDPEEAQFLKKRYTKALDELTKGMVNHD